MKPIKALPSIFTVLFIAVIFTGCTKEKRVERALYKRGGEWNIVSANWEKTAYGDTGWYTITGSDNNVGSFSFDKDQEGFCEYAIDGESYSSNLSWNVVNETVYLTDQESIWDLFDEKVVTFEGTDPDKKGWTLEGSHVEEDWTTGYEITIKATFTLERD